MIMSSVKKAVLFLPSQSMYIYVLVSSYCLARTSSTMLQSSGEREHRCSVPDPGGKALSFSSVTMMSAVGSL